MQDAYPKMFSDWFLSRKGEESTHLPFLSWEDRLSNPSVLSAHRLHNLLPKSGFLLRKCYRGI